MELYLEKGIAHVSIRKIADMIEYSPATIYLYFKNRDEIFWEMHNLAFERFIAALPMSEEQSPAERLRTSMKAYIAFAIENPKLYDIMFIMQAPMRGCPEPSPEAGAVVSMAQYSFDRWHNLVALCIEQGVLKPGSPDTVAFTLWTYLHGIASLLIRDRLRVLPEPQRSVAIQESLALILDNFYTPS